jgi:hypothetical protein
MCQTRPGDPTHYPQSWLRDGAYVVAALARSGRNDAALALVDEFDQRDFFGGYGPEADAPGLALWALAEVLDAEASVVASPPRQRCRCSAGSRFRPRRQPSREMREPGAGTRPPTSRWDGAGRLLHRLSCPGKLYGLSASERCAVIDSIA